MLFRSPQTPNPKPQTPNPKPQTPNPCEFSKNIFRDSFYSRSICKSKLGSQAWSAFEIGSKHFVMEPNQQVDLRLAQGVDYYRALMNKVNDYRDASHKLVKLMEAAGKLLSQDTFLKRLLDEISEPSNLSLSNHDPFNSLCMTFTQQMRDAAYKQAADTYIRILNSHRPSSSLYMYDTPMTLANVCDRMCESVILNGIGNVVMRLIDSTCLRTEIKQEMVRKEQEEQEEQEEQDAEENQMGSSEPGNDQGEACSLADIKFDIPSIFKIFEKCGYEVAYLKTHEEILHIKIEATFFEKTIQSTFSLFDDPSNGINLRTFNISGLRNILDNQLIRDLLVDEFPKYLFLSYDYEHREYKVIKNENQALTKLFQGNSLNFRIGHILGSAKILMDIQEAVLELVKVDCSKAGQPVYFIVAPEYKGMLYEALLKLAKSRYRWKATLHSTATNLRLWTIIEQECSSYTANKDSVNLERLIHKMSDELYDLIPINIQDTIIEYPSKQDLYSNLFGNEIMKDIKNIERGQKIMVTFFTRHCKPKAFSRGKMINTAGLIPHDGDRLLETNESIVKYWTTMTIKSLDADIECRTITIELKLNSD